MLSLMLMLHLLVAGTQQATDSTRQHPSKASAAPVAPAAQVTAPVAAPTQNLTQRETRAESLYISMLEKTNNQLSLWWNPYGVMVAALGALFAIMAIVAAVLLWRQSREHRELVKAMVEQSQALVAAYLEEKNEQLEALRSRLEKQAATYKGAMEEATGDHRKSLEAAIAKVEGLQRALAGRHVIHLPASPASGLSSRVTAARAQLPDYILDSGWLAGLDDAPLWASRISAMEVDREASALLAWQKYRDADEKAKRDADAAAILGSQNNPFKEQPDGETRRPPEPPPTGPDTEG
jgi:hypothetical protein